MRRLTARHLLLALAASAALAGPASAQYSKPEIGSMDKSIEPYQPGEVGVDEKPGALVPGDVQFRDEDGRDVTLDSYLHQGRPVVLWLGYFECPMLCDRMSGGMVRAMRSIKLDAGKEFAVLNVSISADEVPGIAKQKRENYLKELQWPGEARAWNLLTGRPDAIGRLTQAVGYKFKPVMIDGVMNYAHPAVLVILSPEGKVTRYLYPDKDSSGVEFNPQTMRLSLVEAADGKIGSTVDQFLLTCLHYDARTGKYTKDAVALMKIGGGLTVLIMGAIFLPLWIRAARAPRPADEGDPTGHPAPAAR